MKVVIIGNHAAGISAAETLRRGDSACEIVMISLEDVPPYCRCLTPYIVSGEKQVEDILFKPADFYEVNNITRMFGIEVVKVLTEDKAVLLSNGDKVSYDSLIIATGGNPSPVNVPGANNEGVFGLRTLEDAKAINAYAKNIKKAIILGGGLVGLKAAVALKKLGKEVAVMVGSPNVLSQIISQQEAEIFEEHLQEMGVEILTKNQPAVILGKSKVEGVETTEGKKFECQMAVIGKGVRANLGIVQDTGISTNYGILVDEHCRTNVPDVYAVGDVAQSPDVVRKETWMNTLWPHAVEAGRVAAENILGKDSVLKQRTAMNSITIGEVSLISCGLTGAREKVEGADVLTINKPAEKEYRRFIIKDGKLVGFALVGNVAHAGVLTSLVAKEVDVDPIRDKLVSGKYDFSTVLPLIKENKQKFTEPEYEEVLAFF